MFSLNSLNHLFFITILQSRFVQECPHIILLLRYFIHESTDESLIILTRFTHQVQIHLQALMGLQLLNSADLYLEQAEFGQIYFLLTSLTSS